MPEIVLTAAEKAIEQTYVDAAQQHGLIVMEADVPAGNVAMYEKELLAELTPEQAAPLLDEFKAKKWVKSQGDAELGAYPDKYQLARAYCRKNSLKGYPAHLDAEAQWQKDQVETVGLDLAAMAAEEANKTAQQAAPVQDASPAG